MAANTPGYHAQYQYGLCQVFGLNPMVGICFFGSKKGRNRPDPANFYLDLLKCVSHTMVRADLGLLGFSGVFPEPWYYNSRCGLVRLALNGRRVGSLGGAYAIYSSSCFCQRGLFEVLPDGFIPVGITGLFGWSFRCANG